MGASAFTLWYGALVLFSPLSARKKLQLCVVVVSPRIAQGLRFSYHMQRKPDGGPRLLPKGEDGICMLLLDEGRLLLHELGCFVFFVVVPQSCLLDAKEESHCQEEVFASHFLGY